MILILVFKFNSGTITGIVKVVKLTSNNGEIGFCVKQKDYFGLWHYCSQMIAIETSVVISFDTQEKAEEYAQSCRDFVKNRKLAKTSKIEDV